MLALPFGLVFSIPAFRALNWGARAFCSLWAGMLPASFDPVDRARESERFHLSKHSKINQHNNTETEEERVRLEIADLD
jgi:hypothetical protein